MALAVVGRRGHRALFGRRRRRGTCGSTATSRTRSQRSSASVKRRSVGGSISANLWKWNHPSRVSTSRYRSRPSTAWWRDTQPNLSSSRATRPSGRRYRYGKGVPPPSSAEVGGALVLLIEAVSALVGGAILTPGPSSGRSEELQGDVVGIPERKPRAIIGVNDAAVGDAELIHASLPLLQLGSVRTGEGEMI